jgi:hypothetical protein
MKKAAENLAFFYLAASVLLLFLPLLSGNSLFFRDLQLLFMPMKHFLAKCWNEGQLPLWNPGLFCGVPFLSDIQSGVFYPLSIVFYLVPMPYAFNVFVISHYLLASCFVYLLIRHWHCSVPGACLGAVCFTLGGYLVSTANVLNNLQSAIWLPIIFLCLERSSGRYALFYRLLTAIFLAVQFLAGEPQLLLFTVILLFAYHVTVNKHPGWVDRLKRSTSALVLISVVAMTLVMVQLLPTLEMFKHSVRFSGFTFQEAAKFSLNPLALFQLLGPPPFDIYHHVSRPFSWLLSSYFGLIPLIFCATASVCVRDNRVKFWTVSLLISVLFAFGNRTPLFLLLYRTIPFFKAFRFPEKFMFIFAYAMAFLSAYGFDFILEKRHRAGKAMTGIFSLLSVVFFIAVTIQTIWPAFLGDDAKVTPIAFLFMCLGGVCIFLFFKKVIAKSTFCTLVIVVSTVDLVLAHMPLNPVVPTEFYTAPPKLAQATGKARHTRRIFVQRDSWMSQASRLSPFAIQHLWRHYLFANTGTWHNISYLDGVEGAEIRHEWLIAELLEKLSLCKRIRFLELTNTGYLITGKSERIAREVRAERLKRVHENLYEVPGAMPLAYVVPDVVIAADQAKAIEEILKDDFNPRRYVVLEEGSSIPTMGGGGGEVLNILYKGPNRVEVTARSCGGYLVLLDSFYPGWKVLVHGREREVLRANGLFKAVFLDPGMHEIVFSYEPPSFSWGLRISLISLCLVIVGLWVSRPRRPVPGR